MENFLRDIAKRSKPVLIIDELQKIGDIEIDGPLIYELFNFFIGLTKELHLCHVFCVTSDSLFLERVYKEAMLHGRCRFMLVDDFDYETTANFLRTYGFDEEEIDIVWHYFGGKPIYLVEAIKNRDKLEEFCKTMLKIRRSQILDLIYDLEDRRDTLESVLRIFEVVCERGKMEYRKIDEALRICVRYNVLFADPVERSVRPQSKLDLLAMREVLKEFRLSP